MQPFLLKLLEDINPGLLPVIAVLQPLQIPEVVKLADKVLFGKIENKEVTCELISKHSFIYSFRICLDTLHISHVR